jgi:hypothetical protein
MMSKDFKKNMKVKMSRICWQYCKLTEIMEDYYTEKSKKAQEVKITANIKAKVRVVLTLNSLKEGDIRTIEI